MTKEEFKIFFCIFAYAFLVMITSSPLQDVETDDVSRSFTFASLVNTTRNLDSEDAILARYKASSAVHCAHKCLTKKQCQMIGFNAKSGVCWLMKSVGRNGVLKSQGNVILIKVRFDNEKTPEATKKDEEFSSCKEVFEKGRSKGNGIYNIKTNYQSTPTRTYCHMDSLPNCAGGGWTLTMKIDGSEDTFEYASSYWTDRHELETENGLGLEEKESKLPSYWSTPLTKICLGMKKKHRGNDTKWLKLELKKRAASLYDVITTGYPKQPYILLGVNKWKDTFIASAGYNMKNPREGVNVTLYDNSGRVRVRLGVLYLVRNSYLTYLGLGTWGSWHQKYGVEVSCGYGRQQGSTPFYVKIPAFCYILVQ